MLSALEKTRSLLHGTVQRWSVHAAPLQCPVASTSSPLFADSLPLPSTESLLPRLLALGIEEAPAEHIDNAFSQAVSKLEALCRNDYKRRCSSFTAHFQDARAASLVYRTYTTVLTKTSHQWRSYILNDFTPRYIAARGVRTRPHSSSSKKPFNQNAIPTLERFFEENAFPSRLDKYELASKCDMDFKQIHVWFQNRRSRFRKEGRELKKRSSSTPLSDALENSEALLPGDTDDGTATSTSSDPPSPLPMASPSPEPQTDSFNFKAPPHAFPSPFPPCCPYEAFPLHESRPAFSLPWPYASRKERLPRGSVDMSDITSLFAKLAITEEVTDVESLPTRPQSWKPCCLGFITPCSPAPHPALIRRPSQASQSCPSDSPISLRRSSRPGRVAGFPSSSPSTSTSGRPKRCLPRRVPKYPLRCVTPTPSRRSSFDSVSSRSSMSIASTSDSDDPATPPLLPVPTLFSVSDPFTLDESLVQTTYSSDIFHETGILPSFSETSLQDVFEVLSKRTFVSHDVV